jgi:hypothetical protein
MTCGVGLPPLASHKHVKLSPSSTVKRLLWSKALVELMVRVKLSKI